MCLWHWQWVTSLNASLRFSVTFFCFVSYTKKKKGQKSYKQAQLLATFFYKWTSYSFGRVEFLPEKQILITEPVRSTLKVSISVDETYCWANNLLDDSAMFLKEYIIHHCYNNWEAKMSLISFYYFEGLGSIHQFLCLSYYSFLKRI